MDTGGGWSSTLYARSHIGTKVSNGHKPPRRHNERRAMPDDGRGRVWALFRCDECRDPTFLTGGDVYYTHVSKPAVCAACGDALVNKYIDEYRDDTVWAGYIACRSLGLKKCTAPRTEAEKEARRQANAKEREHERVRWARAQVERDRAPRGWRVRTDARRAVAAAAAAVKELQGPSPDEAAGAVASVKTNPANYSTLSKALKVTSAAVEFASDELKANYAIKKQLEAIKEREQQRRTRTEAGAAAALR